MINTTASEVDCRDYSTDIRNPTGSLLGSSTDCKAHLRHRRFFIAILLSLCHFTVVVHSLADQLD